MYLNKAKSVIMSIIAYVLMAVFGFGIAFSILGIIVSFKDINYWDDFANSMSVGFGLLSACLLVFGFAVYMKHPIKIARRFNSLFEGCQGDMITVANAAQSLIQSEEKTVKEFTLAVQKGYLVNCNLTSEPEMTFSLISSDAKTAGERYRSVTCPSCGASLTVQSGFTVECDYCGTKVSG